MLSSRSLISLRKNVCAVIVRHGGGGGRPGGMPGKTFVHVLSISSIFLFISVCVVDNY